MIFQIAFGAMGAFLALLVIWMLVSGLRRRHLQRRQVTDPNGRVWSTRIHWAHPQAGFGMAKLVFDRWGGANRPPRQEVKELAKRQEREDEERSLRSRAMDLMGGLDMFDEGALIVGGVVAALGLIIGIVLFVLLAVELALFLLLAAVFGSVRLVMRHPWTIEVVEPEGEKRFLAVVGLREARGTNEEIRAELSSGIDTIHQRQVQSQITN